MSSVEGKQERHPSWVTVQFSRVSGNRSFFGSSIQSQSWIELIISEAERYTTIGGQDRVQGGLRNQLLRLALSPAQFAELLTTMNVGTGVPGTLLQFKGETIPRYEEKISETKKVRDHFAERLKSRSQAFKDEGEEIVSMLLTKPSISKADREKVVKLINNMNAETNSNMPFYLEMFEESSQKIVSQAKAEVESFVTHAVVSTGLEALKQSSPRLIENSGVDNG